VGALKPHAKPLMHVYFFDAKSTYCGAQNTTAEIAEAEAILKEDEIKVLSAYRNKFHHSVLGIELEDALWVVHTNYQFRVCKECYALHKLQAIA
jgi:hypothetical protein